MGIKLSKQTLGLLLGMLLVHCSGGIGGTGIVAFGPITGFGSVMVNGIEFNTSAATRITLDHNPNRSEPELDLGQIVTVKGALDDDGKTATATRINYADNAEGPVSSIDAPSNSLVVLGQTVLVNGETEIKGIASLAELAVNDIVEVSGLVDAAGRIVASYIDKQPAFVQGVTEIEVKGAISHLTATTFTLGALTVNYALVLPQNLPAAGLSEGLFVEVKATTLPDPASGMLAATAVEPEKNLVAGEGDELDVQGFISGLVSASTFKVNGQEITTDAQTLFENGTVASLANGRKVEVEGTLSQGVLVASKISFL